MRSWDARTADPIARWVARGATDPCDGCSQRASGHVRVTRKRTGREEVVAVCRACNHSLDSVFWLRFEPTLTGAPR